MGSFFFLFQIQSFYGYETVSKHVHRGLRLLQDDVPDQWLIFAVFWFHVQEQDFIVNWKTWAATSSGPRFSQERLRYDAQSATVGYKGKDGRRQKSFDALEWLAAMCSHVPNKGEHMVRYYGYYSNVSRGKRQKTGDDAAMAYILEPPLPDKTFRKNWARLIQKIYEVDPLVCPACRGEMRVIAVIEEQSDHILTSMKTVVKTLPD